MGIPESCGGCFEKQIQRLEGNGERRTVLCPLLAALALQAKDSTPLVERHFLNLAKECRAETHGTGGLYRIQQVQGARAVETAVTIREALATVEQIEPADDEPEELVA